QHERRQERAVVAVGDREHAQRPEHHGEGVDAHHGDELPRIMNEVQLQLLIRAVHILAALLWFAGLFAAGSLLRFRDTETDAGVKQRLGVRSRKAGVLADVGATLSLATGIYQGVTRSLFAQPWLHVKLTLVAV